MTNLKIDFAGVTLRNPIILGSATPSWDGKQSQRAWQAGAGAVVPKSLGPPGLWSRHPRCGRMKLVKNGKQRLGMINIELYTTMTLDEWLERELETACAHGATFIASMVAHPEPAQTAANARKVEATGKAAMFEINVSCPMPLGADQVGFQMGNNPRAIHDQVVAVKSAVTLPVGVKLTPTTADMVPMALAAESAGADFLTIGNSVRSFAGVDIATGRPKLGAYGGYSGPAIKPITQRHVSEVARALQIPISACGGIDSWEDIVEYIMLGATTVQTVTSIMWHGFDRFQKLLQGLSDYMQREGLNSLAAIRGKALPYIFTIEELAQMPPMVARVDAERCVNLKKGGCELCGQSCFYDAIGFSPRLQIDAGKCDGCGLCAEICPSRALTLVEADATSKR